MPRPLLLALVLIIALLIAAFWNYTQDDVFITYVYSRNLAEGVGFVFNPGETVQGTTTPLWTLLMAGVYRLTTELLHAGNLLGGIFLLVTCLFSFSLLRPHFGVHGAGAAALLIATSPLHYASLGMETPLYCALLTGAFWLWSREHPTAAILAAAALTWTRADGVVLAATLILLVLFDAAHSSSGRPLNPRRWAAGIRLGAIYALAIAPWFAFAWVYFGTPLPNTFHAKQELLQGVRFLESGLQHWQTFFGHHPLSLLALALIPFGALRLWRARSLRPLPLWAGLYTLGYTALNITNFWYYTPLVTVLILLAVTGAHDLLRRMTRPSVRLARAALAVVLVSVIGLDAVRAVAISPLPPRMSTYRLAGEWIAEHTPPDATLMVADLGVAGYYARRTTRDSFGLIVPDMYATSPEYAVLKYAPDYVLATRYFFFDFTTSAWFQDQYVSVAQFSTPGDLEFSPMTVYQRRAPLNPPASAPQFSRLLLSAEVELESGAPLREETSAVLRDERGEIVVRGFKPFFEAHYPAEAALGPEHIIETISLPLAVAPGHYTWRLFVNPDPNPISGEIDVLALHESPHYSPADGDAVWPGSARLTGLVYQDEQVLWSGGLLSLTLEWEALTRPAGDFVVFCHLVSAAGALVAQHDGPPGGEARPTSTWSPGEVFIDQREIRLPPDLPEGEYQVLVGWYQWETGTRLPLVTGQDAYRLSIRAPVRFPGGSGLP